MIKEVNIVLSELLNEAEEDCIFCEGVNGNNDCKECKGSGVVLSSAGQKLLGFIVRWTRFESGHLIVMTYKDDFNGVKRDEVKAAN